MTHVLTKEGHHVCACGAYVITKSAWKTLTAAEKLAAKRQMRNCKTCIRDLQRQAMAAGYGSIT